MIFKKSIWSILIFLLIGGFITNCNDVDEAIYGQEQEEDSSTEDPNIPGTLVAFKPEDISNMLLWLDASDTSTIFTDSGCTTAATVQSDPISCWQDKSGNDLNAVQTTLAQAPELDLAAINSLDSIYFPKTNMQSLNLPFTSWQLENNYTAFIVFKQTLASGLGVLFGTFPNATADFMITTTSSTNRNRYYDLNVWKYGSYNSNGDWVINSFSRVGTTMDLFHNGHHDSSFNNLNTASEGAARIGAYTNTAHSNLYQGHISEILWFLGEVSEEDRLKVEGYLAHKWGRLITLSEDHPYKVNEPQTFVPDE